MLSAYHIPEKTEHFNELLEWRRKPMWPLCFDIDSPLYFRAIRTIKNEDGNDGQGQEPTETVEEGANCRVFASSGALSRLNINHRLSLIHPNTKKISIIYTLINLIHLQWINTALGGAFSQIPQWQLFGSSFSFPMQEIKPVWFI